MRRIEDTPQSSVGFDYMGAIIWRKVTTCNTTGGATIMGSFPYPRTDPKKLKFGSRIDHTDHTRETYHTVKE